MCLNIRLGQRFAYNYKSALFLNMKLTSYIVLHCIVSPTTQIYLCLIALLLAVCLFILDTTFKNTVFLLFLFESIISDLLLHSTFLCFTGIQQLVKVDRYDNLNFYLYSEGIIYLNVYHLLLKIITDDFLKR